MIAMFGWFGVRLLEPCTTYAISPRPHRRADRVDITAVTESWR